LAIGLLATPDARLWFACAFFGRWSNGEGYKKMNNLNTPIFLGLSALEVPNLNATPLPVGVGSIHGGKNPLGRARRMKNQAIPRRLNMQKNHVLGVAVALLLAAPVFSAHAAAVSVDCTKKGTTVTAAIAKLTKSVANTVTISGVCTEDVLVSGYTGLTLVGNPGAAITGTLTPSAGTTLTVNGGSTITVQSLTINGGPSDGATGVSCTDRSLCVFDNVVIQGGGPDQTGLSLQNQSAADILGTSIIRNNDTGLGVFGASQVNMRPDGSAGPGPVISANASFGAVVQDGSFLRTDDVRITGNGAGVLAQRGAVIKILDLGDGFGSVDGNVGDGIIVKASVAQVGVTVAGNGGNGVFIRKLAFATVFATPVGNGYQLKCEDPVTSVSEGVACNTP